MLFLVPARWPLLATAVENPGFAKYVRLVGTMPQSLSLQNASRRFPVIERLLPTAIDSNNPNGLWRLQFHGIGWKLQEESSPSDLTSVDCGDASRYICSSEYIIRKDNDRLTIRIR
jgi:hypothetical protein